MISDDDPPLINTKIRTPWILLMIPGVRTCIRDIDIKRY